MTERNPHFFYGVIQLMTYQLHLHKEILKLLICILSEIKIHSIYNIPLLETLL